MTKNKSPIIRVLTAMLASPALSLCLPLHAAFASVPATGDNLLARIALPAALVIICAALLFLMRKGGKRGRRQK